MVINADIRWHNFWRQNNGSDATGKRTVKWFQRPKISDSGFWSSYTRQLLKNAFNNGVEEIEKAIFQSVTKAVEDGYADYGVHLENTTTGGINDSYDILPSSRNYIVAEHALKIKQTFPE